MWSKKKHSLEIPFFGIDFISDLIKAIEYINNNTNNLKIPILAF